MAPETARGTSQGTARGTGAGPSAPQDVIHDIGYRRYTGPRGGRRAIWLALFLESAKGAYGLGRTARAKVVPLLCLAALCLPALVVGAITAATGASELPLEYQDYVIGLQPLVAVFVAAQAPATLSRDLRFGVVPLYFSRPMRRADYVTAKLAAFALAVLVLLATPLTLLLGLALLAELPLGSQLPDYLTALASAALLAVLLAGIGLVLAAVTPRRGTGVAAIVAVLLVLSGVQAVVESIAEEVGRAGLDGWSQLLSPFTLVEALASSEASTTGTAGTVVFALAAVAVPAACWALLARRYRTVSAT